ncbi:MAG: hypothetical protein EP330_07670 [Deltaproteobacteria bacterium]|nr:MAG: hypothetical protein EP330_07670 [Deltaproteobacteria bacterium]
MRPWVLLPILLIGCDNQIEPSGGIFEPVRETPAAPAAAAKPAPTPAEGGFDFDADARDEEEAGVVEKVDGEPVNIAAALGLPTPDPVPEPEPEPEVAPPVAAAPAWNPAQPIGGDWGVTVLSTTPQAQPPVAVLRFANGPDTVVHPGDLLADQGIVVMAIGRDAVQIARVSAEGDHAKVTSEVVPMLSRPPLQLTVQ